MTSAKKVIYGSAGLLLGAAMSLSIPALAGGSKQFFTDSVVYKKVVEFRNSLKNPNGAVKINDDLTVTGDLRVQGSHNLTISAEDVEIQTVGVTAAGTNYLESTNLQTALDNELAVNFDELLPGTTWSVENITSDDTYANTTGQVTFSDDGSFSIDSGWLAAIGVVEPTEDTFCSTLTSDISYTLYNNGILYTSWATESSSSESAVVTAFATNKDSIGLVGSGGCGQVGIDRISILTRVTDTE